MHPEDQTPATPATATVTVDLRRRHAALARQRRLLGGLAVVPGFRIGVRWQGADGVSGDFYDTWAMPDGRIQIALGDVSGHGMPAALVMASLLKTLRLRRATAPGPGLLLAALNRDLSADLAPGDFATLWIAEIAPGGTAVAAAAGHHPAFLVRADGVYRVEVAGPALGLVPDRRYAPLVFRLAPGEWLVQCSDGILEALGRDDLPFGDERVAAALAGLHGSGLAIEAVPDALAAAVAAWAGRAPDDDLTIVAVALDGADDGGSGDGESSAAREAIAAWPLPGRRIDAADPAADYLLGPAIGSGGAGVVHEAVQAALGRAVAVKRAARPDREAALLREGLIAAVLEHPHVLPVHEAGRDATLGAFLAMRRPAGTPWRPRLAALGLDRNLEILLAVAEAAAGAHRHGIVHRDIKPDNVLLGEDGAVYLFDWGVAAAAPGLDPRLARIVLPPRPGQAAGSPAYMAPEQARGDAADIGPATDVWLLGAILVEILTGRPPHPGDGVDEALAAAAAAASAPAIDPEEPLGRVVAAACDPDPRRRPRDGTAFRDMLAHCRRDRQALLMVREAQRRSDEAGSSLAAHLRALAVAEEALRLRPDGPGVAGAVARVRGAYAGQAIAQGELGLAATLIDPGDPGHAPLAAALERAQEARRREERRRVRLEDLDRRMEGSWLVVGEGLDGAWEAPGLHLVRAGGHLVAEGDGMVAATAPGRVAGDVQVVASLVIRPGGRAGCFIGRRPGSVEGGYTALAGEGGCELLRHGEVMARSAGGVTAGEPFQMVVQRLRHSVRVWVRDRQVLAWEEPDPANSYGADRAGVCGTGRVAVAAWRQLRHGHPEVEDGLALVERMLRRGRPATALDILEDIGASASGPRADRVAGLRTEAEADLASARALAGVAEETRRRLPAAEVAVRRGRLAVALPDGCADLGPLHGLPIGELTACRGPLEDLGALAGMALHSLDIAGQRVSRLDPLAGMPLGSLSANRNPIADLAPLRGLPLARLLLNGSRIADLGPLAGMRLEVFDAGSPMIRELGPLAGQPLMELWLAGCPLTDLGPLAGAPLQRMSLIGTEVVRLDALRGAPLRVVYLDRSRVADLGPLAGAPLRYLNLAFTPVTDLGPLAGAPLQELVITGCTVASVAPLAACPIRRLIYGPHVPEGLDRLPPECHLTLRTGTEFRR